MGGLGENLSSSGATKHDGNFLGSRFGYASGPFDIAVATGKAKYAAGDMTFYNLGASYDFKVAKIMSQLGSDERKGPVYSKARYWLVGTIIPAGAGYFRASYGRTNVNDSPNDATLAAVGYVYTLSKRTSIYTALSQIDNKGTGTLFTHGVPITQPGGKSKAFDVGIRHDF